MRKDHHRLIQQFGAAAAGDVLPAAQTKAQPMWVRHCLMALAAALILITVSMHLATMAAGDTGQRTDWEWPVGSQPDVLRPFDKPAEPWLSGHRGVDLDAGRSDEIRAPADGRITFAGWVVDRPVVTITHPSGLRSSFESVATDLSEGDKVSGGQVIGRLSEPLHCGATACLHWGVRQGEEYLNPLQFVADLRPSVLLPVP